MKGRHLVEDFVKNRIANAEVIEAMTPQMIVDSHIHLWPESMSNEDGHSWMTPGMPLAKQHLLSDYDKAAQQGNTSTSGGTIVGSVVYVETDVRYDKPDGKAPMEVWTKGPLNEIRFLRQIVEGDYGERDARMLQGIVLWAPMDQPTAVLEEWLGVAEQVAGPNTWNRVKGFRFLFQSILDQKRFEQVVFSGYFIANLRLLGKMGLSFDVGVDQRSGGAWQLEAMSKSMDEAHEGVPSHEKVIFIINHLCKPDFEHDGAHFARWRRAVEMMATHEKTYMKLSGAFSELPEALGSVKEIVTHVKPWFKHVLDHYTVRRVMFGSDWPVCNVKRKNDGAWTTWRDVVKALLDDESFQLSKDDKEMVWRGTAVDAYRLEPGY